MADNPVTRRVRIGAVLLLGVLVLLVWITASSVETANHPAPQTIEASEGEATIFFATDRTQFVFPGDCSTVRWELGGIRAVHFYSYPMTGVEERVVCHGDAPYLRVRFQDGTEQTYTLNRDVLFLRPLVITISLLALTMGALGAYLLGINRRLATPRAQYVAALVIAISWILILDLFTNSAYIVIGPTFDAARTMEIARNGWLGNPNVLARAISDLLRQPLDAGFTVIAYMGAVAQLTLVFALARRFGAGFRAAIVAMLVVSVSFFNLRFLLSDIYRPDHLAYPLMLLALLALFRRQFALCAGVMCRDSHARISACSGSAVGAHTADRGGTRAFVAQIVLAGGDSGRRR